MARLAVLTDRAPNDSEWKGHFAWNIILSLAESQHEVLALTTLDPASIEVAHSRLTVVRPAAGWSLLHSPKWIRALFQFRPEIVHTFSLKPTKTPKALTIWPLLESALSAMPRIRRYSTSLSNSDFAPFRGIETPLELQHTSRIQDTVNSIQDTEQQPNIGSVIVPGAVSEWHRPQSDLLLLNEFLLSNRETHAHVIGGWGDWTLSERRSGWKTLEEVQSQVTMGPALDFAGFVELARTSRGFWLRCFHGNSWRSLVAAHVARQLTLATWGEVPQLNVGSSANFLSRLYSQ